MQIQPPPTTPKQVMPNQQHADKAPRRTPWKAGIVAEPTDVVANETVAGEYRHLIVRCGSELLAAAPGQFFQLLCPQSAAGHAFLRRPMSVYALDAGKRQLEFLYKVTGAGTRGLGTLTAGDRLDVMGPLGRGFTLDPSWRHIAAVGRGAGLATLAPLAGAARRQGVHVTAVLSARTPDLLVCEDLFRGHGADVVTVSDADATSAPANVERIVRQLIMDGMCDAFFTCGSSRLIRLLQRLSAEFGLPGQVAVEQQMACGIGLCHCCVRAFAVDGGIVDRRVCWEGPVFNLAEILS
jgi:dihydroorotate dehydrogenase electron transfer subunit